MLILHRTVNGHVDLIEIEGRLTLNEAAGVRRRIKRIVAAGHGKLIIDLPRLNYIDSMGLAVFVSIMKAMNERDGRVVLAGIPQDVLALIELSRLHSIFEIFPTLEGAMAAMSAPPIATTLRAQTECVPIAERSPAPNADGPRRPALPLQQTSAGLLTRIWASVLSLAQKEILFPAQGKTST